MLLIGVILLEVFMFYPDLPDQVPIHFGGGGEPDAYGSKSTIWLTPILSAVIYAGLTFLWRYPNLYNYPVEVTEDNAVMLYTEGRSMIRSVKAATAILFLYISHRSIMVAMGNASGLGSYMVPLMITGLLVLLVYHVVRMTRFK